MAAPKQRHDTIPGFDPIAPTIWVYTPTLPPGIRTWRHSLDAPSLIVLFPWTGAQGRHVSKYITTYQTLFPTTPMLVITTSTKDLCIRTPQQKQQRLRPAIDWLLRNAHSNILVHAFSEGGSNKAVELAETYHAATRTRFPCTALCLDSTLGHPRYLRLCNALRKSLPPNPVLRGMGMLFGGAFLGLLWVLYRCFIGYSNNAISQTRSRILDPEFWDLAAPRCYLYSEADEMIDVRDISEHVEETVALGVPVLDVRFEKSDHCRHVVEDPERYWRSVMMTWRSWRGEKPVAFKGGFFMGGVVEVPAPVAGRGSWSDAGSDYTIDAREETIGVAF